MCVWIFIDRNHPNNFIELLELVGIWNEIFCFLVLWIFSNITIDITTVKSDGVYFQIIDIFLLVESWFFIYNKFVFPFNWSQVCFDRPVIPIAINIFVSIFQYWSCMAIFFDDEPLVWPVQTIVVMKYNQKGWIIKKIYFLIGYFDGHTFNIRHMGLDLEQLTGRNCW